MTSLVLFLILGKKLKYFSIEYHVTDRFYFVDILHWLRKSHAIPNLLKTSMMNEQQNLSHAFMASVRLIIWFFFFLKGLLFLRTVLKLRERYRDFPNTPYPPAPHVQHFLLSTFPTTVVYLLLLMNYIIVVHLQNKLKTLHKSRLNSRRKTPLFIKYYYYYYFIINNFRLGMCSLDLSPKLREREIKRYDVLIDFKTYL